MKIRAERATLADTLTWVAQVIPKRPNVPILAGVRLTAGADVLTVAGFDYDTAHTARLEVDVVTPGECVVSGHFLRDIVGSLRGHDVELVLDDDRLTITAGRSTYRTQVLRVEDYPRLPEHPAALGSTTAETLMDLIGTCRATIDPAAVTDVLQGMRIEAGELLTGTGARKEAITMRTVAAWDGQRSEAFTVPIKALEPAARGMAGDVTLSHADGVMGLADASRSVTTRVLAGDYPNLRPLIRAVDDDAFECRVDSDDLTDAVKRAGALADEGQALVLQVTANEISIEIAGGRGGGTDVIAAESTGEITVALTHRYLLDALSTMRSGVVRLGFGTTAGKRMQPITIRPVDGTDRVSLVMPRHAPGGTR